MMRFIFFFTAMMGIAGASYGAGPQTMQQSKQQPNCSQLNAAEQKFAAQIMDMNNKRMFCAQFTAQQRQQSMQLMGQPDSSGNPMNADQAVMQVMNAGSMSNPSAQQKPRTSGGCPVK